MTGARPVPVECMGKLIAQTFWRVKAFGPARRQGAVTLWKRTGHGPSAGGGEPARGPRSPGVGTICDVMNNPDNPAQPKPPTLVSVLTWTVTLTAIVLGTG